MKVAFFSTKHFEKEFYLNQRGAHSFEVTYFEVALNQQTARLANGYQCVCCFVSDTLDATTLELLLEVGVKLIALRSAGYNNVDISAASRLGLTVVRVPAYSPHAVAEFTVGTLMSLNRKIHKAYARVRDHNFSLEGLMGFDLFGKTVGVIGTGRIGSVFAEIMKGFGCKVLASDPVHNPDLIEKKVVDYVTSDVLYKESDIISLHVPLLPETQHVINSKSLAQMKPGVIVINTGRGALIDSAALLGALKSGHIGGACLDVYEEEEGVFYNDLSDQVLEDDVLARLLTFPNVLVTSHQAFFTREALKSIADMTMRNISNFETGAELYGQVHMKTHII